MSGTLDWTVHPFAERRGMGLTVLAVMIAAGIGARLWTGSWFWGAFSFLVLFLSLESFYFPTRFHMDEAKVVVFRRFSRSEREWGVFRRCYLDREGLMLSPYRKSTWLETYRAIRIRFSRDNREAVIAYVRERLGPDVEWSGGPEWKRNGTTA